MKKSVFISLIMAGIILGCTQQEDTISPIEGAWQVVSWQSIAGDTLAMELGADYTGTEIKIWSEKYFNFVGYYTSLSDSTVVDNYGGGSYTLDGTHCEESYLYFSAKSMVGTTQKLLLEIRNDTLIQTWPCDDNWQIDQSNYNIQKLTRKE